MKNVGPFAFGKGGNKGFTEKQKLAQDHIKAANARGAQCLAMNEFKDYLDSLMDARRATVDFLISYMNPDPVAYAFVVRTALVELQAAEELYKLVSKDLKSEPPTEGN